MVTSMQVLRAPWAPQHPGARNPEWFCWDKESARGGTLAGKTGSTRNPRHISQISRELLITVRDTQPLLSSLILWTFWEDLAQMP